MRKVKLSGLLAIGGCALIIFACTGKIKRTSLDEQNLKGKVKMLTESTFSAAQDGLVKGRLLQKIVSSYDADGNKVEELHYRPDSLTELITFKYNFYGKRAENRWHDTDYTLSKKATFRYDSKGNKIEKRWSNINGDLLKKASYVNDGNGKRVEEIIYSPFDSSWVKRMFRYDSAGNMTEEVQSDPDDSIIHCYRYLYPEIDLAGNWIKKVQMENGKLVRITKRAIIYY